MAWQVRCTPQGWATANLDSSCARRLCNTAGRGEETGFPRSNKETDQERCAAPKPLDKKAHTRGARIDPHGYDAGKKIKGKKRHILVDTLGLLLHAIIHPADIQDRDGGILLLSTLFGLYPFLKKLFADGGYQGPQFQKALADILPAIEIEIVRRSDQAKGFVVLPRRWVVERTIAWLNRCRRLAKDWENLNRKALAFLRLASIRLMLRKLCNPT
jgi:transposase